MTNWQPLTPSDIPHFVETLRHYPLSMDDNVLKYPMQFYRLRIASPDTYYVLTPEKVYMALDPIGPHDAVIHFIRDPTCRHRKKKYLDIGKKFILACFNDFSLNRLTLTVVEGAKGPFKIAQILGFTLEGTLRKCRIIDGKMYDIHIFGLLREELGGCVPALNSPPYLSP